MLYCCCPPFKLSFSFSSFQIYLITTLLVFSLPKFSETYRDLYWTHILPFILPVAHVGLMGSTYSTLALAVERYVAVCHPFQARRFVTTETRCSFLMSGDFCASIQCGYARQPKCSHPRSNKQTKILF